MVHEIGVRATQRRLGIGRLLIDAAIAWARDRDASDVELQVYAFGESAIGFYERLGFTAVKHTMAMPVGSPKHESAPPDRR